MRTADSVLTLLGELRDDYSNILAAYRSYRAARARADLGSGSEELDLAAVAFYLHNLYNAFESYFLRISKFFENSLDREEWHLQLLGRMSLAIEGLRPALLSPDLVEPLEELLKFRHSVRNLDKSKLNPVRLKLLEQGLTDLDNRFGRDHETYLQWLGELAERLGSGAER